MAKVRVKSEGKSVLIEVFPRCGYGGPVFEEDPKALPWRIPKRRGRPRKDTKALRITELREQHNETWRSVDAIAAAEFPGTKPEAPRSLYRSRKHAPNNPPMGRLEQIFLQLNQRLQPRTLRLPKRRGRPRKDQIRVDGQQMYREGNDWEQVKIKLDPKYGQYILSDSYRRLCSPAKPLVPWRKLDLNSIRELAGIKSS